MLPRPQGLFSKEDSSVARPWCGFVMAAMDQVPVRYSVLGEE